MVEDTGMPKRLKCVEDPRVKQMLDKVTAAWDSELEEYPGSRKLHEFEVTELDDLELA